MRPPFPRLAPNNAAVIQLEAWLAATLAAENERLATETETVNIYRLQGRIAVLSVLLSNLKE